jgi:hypothetical protein
MTGSEERLWGAIEYVSDKAPVRPQEGLSDAQEAPGGTVRDVRVSLRNEMGIGTLAREVSADICFAEECVSNLTRLENEHILGSLGVLEGYLRYLDAVAEELCFSLMREGDAA